MFNPTTDYWHPKHKFEIVNWFVSNNILTYAKANRMNFKNLWGKYKECREKQIRTSNAKNFI